MHAIALRPYYAPANWWQRFATGLIGAWDAEVAGNYAASLLDLSGNGNHLVELNGAVSWAAGWQFSDELLQGFDTGVTPASSAVTLMIKFSDVVYGSDGATLMGASTALDGSANIGFMPVSNINTRTRYLNGNVVSYVPATSAGTLALSQWQGYRDGSPDGAPIAGSSPTYLYPLAIGCGIRRTALYDNFITANIQKAAIWSAALSAEQIAAIYQLWS
jgi:glycine/D-amino acid oxidase-like deaminating enzyme